jgi:hypothetical protein
MMFVGALPRADHSPLKPRYETRVVSSSSSKLWGKKRVRRRTPAKRARLTGISWTWDVRESSKVWVGWASSAEEKSMSSRLRKTCSVRGAEGESLVRRRREWSLTWAVNLGEALAGIAS